MKKFFLFFALTLALGAISSYATGADGMIDSRDSQTWMTENLNYKVKDGDKGYAFTVRYVQN